MNATEIQALAQSDQLPGGVATVVETHISWVLLNPNFAFKIKKPVQLSFLDYRLRAQRRYYCERELALNRRFSPDVYLNVWPVGRVGQAWTIGPEVSAVADYAVQMKRLDTRRQLNYLLEAGGVNAGEVTRLAQVVANFHRRAEKIAAPLNPGRLTADYGDVELALPVIAQLLGPAAAEWLQLTIEEVGTMLHSWADRLARRASRGWRIDGHGDLHAHNVFLYPHEVKLFDCVEFNDSWRQVDVLDELAFLSLDFDYHHRPDLQQVLWDSYQTAYPTCLTSTDRQLFNYFCLYRASVRIKVAALRWTQLHSFNLASAEALPGSERLALAETQQIKRYFQLMKGYWAQLASTPSQMCPP